MNSFLMPLHFNFYIITISQEAILFSEMQYQHLPLVFNNELAHNL